jgi:hypothetical protein
MAGVDDLAHLLINVSLRLGWAVPDARLGAVGFGRRRARDAPRDGVS